MNDGRAPRDGEHAKVPARLHCSSKRLRAAHPKLRHTHRRGTWFGAPLGDGGSDFSASNTCKDATFRQLSDNIVGNRIERCKRSLQSNKVKACTRASWLVCLASSKPREVGILKCLESGQNRFRGGREPRCQLRNKPGRVKCGARAVKLRGDSKKRGFSSSARVQGGEVR